MAHAVKPLAIEPIVYLSTSHNKWRVIAHGGPICADVDTPLQAMRAADTFRLEVAPVAWNGDRAEWVTTSTIEGL